MNIFSSIVLTEKQMYITTKTTKKADKWNDTSETINITGN